MIRTTTRSSIRWWTASRSRRQDPNIASDVQFLQSVTSGVNGWNFLQLPIELIQGFNPSKQELQYLGNAWLASYDTGFFLNLLEIIPFYVDQSFRLPRTKHLRLDRCCGRSSTWRTLW